MMRLCAHAWCGGLGPRPPRKAIDRMLAELAPRLAGRPGYRPAALRCESWPRPADIEPRSGHDFFARLTIAIEPGPASRALAAWYQWQHPRWDYSDAAFPEIGRLIAAGTLRAAQADGSVHR